jgi:hypothetical protein
MTLIVFGNLLLVYPFYLNDNETNTMSASQLVDIYDVIVRKEADLARTTAEHRQMKIKMNVLFGTPCVLRFLRFLINSGCTYV